MKTILLILPFLGLLAQQSLCNNIQVSNVHLTGQNTTSDFTMVEFDITWENSWRYANGPANWDAAWIFVKYRISPGGDWKHAVLHDTGHAICAGNAISVGLLTPGVPYNSSTNPGLGAFLYRNNPGTGTYGCQQMQLRWNYGMNTVPDDAVIDVKVFAIECVYIPQGSFSIGAGGTEVSAFYTYPTVATPYLITSEGTINVGTTNGFLYYAFSANGGDQSGPIPGAFPKGYNAFYAMKYEITQQGYVDFLNTLTRMQQNIRVAANISGTSVSNRYVLANWPSPFKRSYVSCLPTIPLPPGQVEFFCDRDNNSIGSDAGEGKDVACNFITYGDVAAYLDWACLRPMTEFEYEKCGRGPLPPYAEGFAWGNAVLNRHTGVTDFGTALETPIHPISNAAGVADDGPLRVGAFARPNSDRVQAGAGYYGVMELSSNLNERPVTVGNPTGRNFTGTHGDGLLSASGDQNVASWPVSSTGLGASSRGSYYEEAGTSQARLSDRWYGAFTLAGRSNALGGRGVRTAE